MSEESLLIDPGHGGIDPGTNGFGVVEKDWTLKISLYQYKRLKKLGANVSLSRNKEMSLNSTQRTRSIRDKYTYCMSNHFNGFNGKARGVEIIHSIFAKDTLARKLANGILEVSGLPLKRVFDKGNSYGTDYYYMHRLTGRTKTVIVEYGFMDNADDHAFYKNEKNFFAVAEKMVEVWCDILGVTYTAKESEVGSVPKPSLNEKEVNFYVQAGAYSTIESAEAMQERLQDLGMDSMIKPFHDAKQPEKAPTTKPALKVNGTWDKATTTALQKALKTIVDGIISGQYRNSVTEEIYGVEYGKGGSLVVRKLQAKIGAKVDSYIGRETITKLQKYLGTYQDGVISKPSAMVKELQHRLNAGTF